MKLRFLNDYFLMPVPLPAARLSHQLRYFNPKQKAALLLAAANKIIRFTFRSIVIPAAKPGVCLGRPESSIYDWFSIFAETMSEHRPPPV